MKTKDGVPKTEGPTEGRDRLTQQSLEVSTVVEEEAKGVGCRMEGSQGVWKGVWVTISRVSSVEGSKRKENKASKTTDWSALL